MRISRSSPFLFTGILGFILGTVSGFVLNQFIGGEVFVMCLMMLAIVVAFFIQVFVGKIIRGSEVLIFYRYFVFSALCVAFVLWVYGVPLLFYLDLFVIGFGIFQFIGRIGCFLSGCCYGRPAKIGIYLPSKIAEHAFKGVRLFPVQLTESLGILVITGVCIGLLLSEHPVAGEPFMWYVVLYSVLRFFLELLRGDNVRMMVLNFSEAQWTGIMLVIVIVLYDWMPDGTIDHDYSILGMVFFCIAAMAGLVLNLPAAKNVSVQHIHEIAQAVNRPLEAYKSPAVVTTSRGVTIALSFKDEVDRQLWYCSLTCVSDPRPKPAVIDQTVQLIQLLKFKGANFQLIQHNKNIYYYLFKIERS